MHPLNGQAFPPPLTLQSRAKLASDAIIFQRRRQEDGRREYENRSRMDRTLTVAAKWEIATSNRIETNRQKSLFQTQVNTYQESIQKRREQYGTPPPVPHSQDSPPCSRRRTRRLRAS